MLRDNCARNNLSSVSVAHLDWTDVDSFGGKRAPFDVILGCEVVYNDNAHADLANTINVLATREKARVILSYHERDKREAKFFEAMKANGWVCHCHKRDDNHQDDDDIIEFNRGA